tara:strand:+ start:1939 stop:3249 length:1311 start_codon:yes stop_codon:yes gene_type:complete
MIYDARYHAFKILKKFYQKNDRLKSVRDNYYKHNSLSQNDLNRSLVLTNEVVRWSRRLDSWISLSLDKPLKKLNPSIHLLLKLGYFEATMDEEVPNHAVVNSWVELTKLIMGKKFSGLVNALLRKAIKLDSNKRNNNLTHGEWLSFPDWMLERWIDQYNEEQTLSLCDYYNSAPYIDVRLNTSKFKFKKILNKIDTLGIDWEKSPESDRFIRIKSGMRKLLKSEPFMIGMINIQDRASGAVVELLDPQEGETILDVCAAPGTKTNYILEKMNFNGHLFASDISSERLMKAQTRASNLNLSIEWSKKDASIDKFPMADRILIDAPCSGTGVIGRRPDIRWRREKLDFDSMNVIQMDILNNMSKYVKPKGTIVYATCSLEEEENWNVVNSFLKLNDNFKIKSEKSLIPKEWINEKKCLETFPPKDKVDGMFAVNIQKV